MSKIVELINSIEKVKAIGGASDSQISEAENALGVSFSADYRDYLKNFGVIRFNGIELCGLNISGYLNVVDATMQEKDVNDKFPEGMYVIEDLGVDARLIIGDSTGNVYLLQRDKKKLICSSFTEYVEKCKMRIKF